LARWKTGRHFLTEVKLDIGSPVNITLEFDDFIAQAKAKKLIVSNYNPDYTKTEADMLDIFLSSENPSDAGAIKKILSMFAENKQNEDLKNSFFRTRRVRVFSQKNLNFTIDKGIVGTTPQLICTSQKTLRLIINRETPTPKTN
jgi:diacylglycerol kinase family enzyme